jgi:hypothetical protein
MLLNPFNFLKVLFLNDKFREWICFEFLFKNYDAKYNKRNKLIKFIYKIFFLN